MKVNFTDAQILDLIGKGKDVAKLCNVSEAAVTQWRTRGIPYGQLCILGATIEKNSYGLVTRKDLFPNGWHYIWPELANKDVVV
jgi:DNA-binding transcriptional regulator YdaS (Cro superfamily)